ncbi:hypothetical protein KDU71_10220 [Carboxylicivirga sediminis]|uniref:Uncharacterized protein n=1 Tax=Carboxylicivirga sediminis TaxID=2006564 RepID=A0A941IYL9_9BACT|nr:hypothetical protein [Carboxylicivirga sediminis]MBR8535932.1 hypothetical protein [Carboxylicivirga sediminis]
MNFKQNTLKLMACLLLAISCIMPLHAQQQAHKLYENVSKDSLMFLTYFNKDKFTSELLSEFLSEFTYNIKSELIQSAKEVCLYGHKDGAFNHYTLQFRRFEQFPLNQVDEILKKNNLTIEELNPTHAIINGGKYRKGIFWFNKEYFELKIFAQIEPIDRELKKEYNRLINIQHTAVKYDMGYEDIAFKLDSLDRLDSVNSALSFKALLETEKNAISRPVKRQVDFTKVFDENTDDCGALLYINPQHAGAIPYHVYNVLGNEIPELYEHSSLTAGLMQHYEEVWFKLSANAQQIAASSIAVNKATLSPINQPIDKHIAKYLPAKTQALYIYNANLASFKNNLASYLDYKDFDREERAVARLALLAFDDELAKHLGNGFVAITDSCLNGRDMPDFKAAIHMPNRQKGATLLSILQNDLKLIKKVSEGAYTFHAKKLGSDKALYLNTRHSTWLLGTSTPVDLERTLSPSELKQHYPELFAGKTSQFLFFNASTLSSSKIDFQKVQLKTQILKKNRIHTTVLIDLK